MVLASAATGFATLLTAGALLFQGGSTDSSQQNAPAQQVQQTEQRPSIEIAVPAAQQSAEVTETTRSTSNDSRVIAPVNIRSVRMLELSGLRLNGTLSDDLFRFEPPPGVQIYEP